MYNFLYPTYIMAEEDPKVNPVTVPDEADEQEKFFAKTNKGYTCRNSGYLKNRPDQRDRKCGLSQKGQPIQTLQHYRKKSGYEG